MGQINLSRKTGQARPVILAVFMFFTSLSLNLVLYGANYGSFGALTSLPDAQGYAVLGDALLSGVSPPKDLVSLRGFGYPSIAMLLAGHTPLLLVFVQTLAVAVGAGCLADIEHRLVGMIRLTPLAFLSISLLLAPGVMMTEAFAFLFAASAIRAFVVGSSTNSAVLLLGVATIIKPVFLPILVVSLLSLRLKWSGAVVLGIMIALFGIQTSLSQKYDGAAQITSAGQVNFSDRFFPAVYGEVEGLGFVSYKSSEADEARRSRPDTQQKVGYVLSHPYAMIRTWGLLLWHEHLSQHSGYAQDIKRPLAAVLVTVSGVLNTIFIFTGCLGLVGSVMFLREANWRQWFGVLVAPAVILTAPLVYWQGDRIVFIPLLLLLPFASFALSTLSTAFGRAS